MLSKTHVSPHAAVQILDLDSSALKFQVPMAMSISGPSQSGTLKSLIITM